MQTWYDCTGFDNTSFVVAGVPEGRERVVMVGAKIAPGADEADRKAVRHILDSFEADCETLSPPQALADAEASASPSASATAGAPSASAFESLP